jgi:hypothetical protein
MSAYEQRVEPPDKKWQCVVVPPVAACSAFICRPVSVAVRCRSKRRLALAPKIGSFLRRARAHDGDEIRTRATRR